MPALAWRLPVCSGDPANVAFQALYRADVPRYIRHDPSRLASLLRTPPRRAVPRAGRNPLPTEADGHRGGGAAARYHAPTAARRERSGRLRRWRKPPPPPNASRRRAVLPPGSYLPLDASKDGQLPPEPAHDVDRPATFYQVYVPAAQRQAAAAAAAAAAATQPEPAPQPVEPVPAAAPLEAESREEYVLRRTR